MASTYETITTVLVEQFEVDQSQLGPDVTFEELGMDSLFMVELLVVLQTELGVEISEDTATPRDTIGRAAELVEKQVTAAASS
jgi:acyl carrier protein